MNFNYFFGFKMHIIQLNEIMKFKEIKIKKINATKKFLSSSYRLPALKIGQP